MARTRLNYKTALMSVILMTGATVLSGSSSVFAGFEWKGASSRSSSRAQRVPPVESMSVPSSASNTADSISDSEIVSGFGSNLPLMVVLRQIVPPGYNVSLDVGVSPDRPLSWKGGKPWKKILADTLAAHKLGFRLQGHDLTVGRFKTEEKTRASRSPIGKPAAPPIGLTKVDKIPLDMVATAETPERAGARLEAEELAPMQLTAAAPAAPKTATAPPMTAATPVAEIPAVPVAEMAAAPVTEIAWAEGAHDVEGTKARPVGAAWSAARGYTLREVLTDWTRKSGVALYWSIDYDYRLNSNIAYSGSFEDAVGRLLDQFTSLVPRPFGELHMADGSPRVLVISVRDNVL